MFAWYIDIITTKIRKHIITYRTLTLTSNYQLYFVPTTRIGYVDLCDIYQNDLNLPNALTYYLLYRPKPTVLKSCSLIWSHCYIRINLRMLRGSFHEIAIILNSIRTSENSLLHRPGANIVSHRISCLCFIRCFKTGWPVPLSVAIEDIARWMCGDGRRRGL